MSATFLLTTLIVVVSPGVGVLYTLAAGLARGPRAAVVAAVGCTLGIVPHLMAAVLGLAALLHASLIAFEVLRFLGVAYLLWMAWRMLQERGDGSVFMAATLIVFVVYGVCAAAVRTHVLRSQRVLAWLRRSFAVAFALLGFKLALAER